MTIFDNADSGNLLATLTFIQIHLIQELRVCCGIYIYNGLTQALFNAAAYIEAKRPVLAPLHHLIGIDRMRM